MARGEARGEARRGMARGEARGAARRGIARGWSSKNGRSTSVRGPKRLLYRPTGGRQRRAWRWWAATLPAKARAATARADRFPVPHTTAVAVPVLAVSRAPSAAADWSAGQLREPQVCRGAPSASFGRSTFLPERWQQRRRPPTLPARRRRLGAKSVPRSPLATRGAFFFAGYAGPLQPRIACTWVADVPRETAARPAPPSRHRGCAGAACRMRSARITGCHSCGREDSLPGDAVGGSWARHGSAAVLCRQWLRGTVGSGHLA